MSGLIINPYAFASGGGGGGTPFTGVTSMTVSTGLNAGSTTAWGWRFTVGASPLTVTKLRHYGYPSGAATWNVSIYRDSDGALITQADIVKVFDAWAEESVTPVVLAAGTTYSIAGGVVSGGTLAYRDPSPLVINALVTKDANVYGNIGVRPTTTHPFVFVPMCDFGGTA